jgi:hypothetical protein
VIRIPHWLFLLIAAVLFLGGCVSSIRPVWSWVERGWIHLATESDKPHFPVLVRGADRVFALATLGDIPTGSAIVTNGFDDPAINRDLNARISSKGDHKFFQVLGRTSNVTRVTLEVPTTRDSMLKTWYDIRDDQVIPQRIMRYGPGFAFLVIPLSTACGIATVLIFAIFIRPRKRSHGVTKT